MSSILKALKKIDDRKKDSSVSFSSPLSGSRTEAGERPPFRYTVISILLSILVLFGGAWFFIDRNPHIAKKIFPNMNQNETDPAQIQHQRMVSSTALNSSERQMESLSVVTVPEKRNKPHLPQPPQKTPTKTSPQKPLMEASLIPVPANINPKRESGVSVPTGLKKRKIRGSEQLVTGKRKIDHQPVPKPKKPPVQSILKKSIAERTDTPVEKPDPGVKLQALVWSADREKRMAVINDFIVKTGDMVEGYVVDTISRDRVVLRNGSRKMALEFKLNQ